MTYTVGKRALRSMSLRGLLSAASLLWWSISLAAAPMDATVAAEEICMPEGTYPMVGGGTTVFSSKICFSRPVTDTDPREIRVPRAKKSATDTFNGVRVVRYDYHDALYHCVKRHMRLPTVEELKALFEYANAGNTTATESKYGIVALKSDPRYPDGLYGWGGSSIYWSHTFAGKRIHKVINLTNGRVSNYHDPHRSYVSCVR